MSWATAILQPELQVRFYLQIQGIGDVYLDGDTPVGPDGTAWAAPTSKGFAYVFRPKMLDVSEGIQVSGAEIKRREGSTAPGSLTIRLRDGRSNYLLGLFARERSTGKEARLAADLAYDTTGNGTTITADNVAPWPAAGYVYLGRETAYYGTKTGTTVLNATAAAGGARDVFSIGNCDITSDYNDNKPLGPRVLTDYPAMWHGRYVRLFAFLCDVEGRAMDAAIGGTYGREIWRGIIQGDPVPEDDWTRWKLDTRSVDVILQTEVGRAILGSLLHAKPTQGPEALANLGDYAADGNGVVYWIDANTDTLRFLVEYWADAATFGTAVATSATLHTVTLTHGLRTSWELTDEINAGIAATLGPATAAPALTATFYRNATGGFWVAMADTDTVGGIQGANRITWFFGEAGSVGPLLGWETSYIKVADGTLAPSDAAPGDGLAAYIHPDATSIPVYQAALNGIMPDAIPSSGYAKIGGKEIVYYGSVTDADNAVGVKVLGDVVRGKFGTEHLEHRVPFGGSGTEDDGLEVVFGQGWDGTSLFTAALQLGISTGSAHHGTYDTLGARVGPGLAPAHFDTGAIEALAAGIQPWLGNVGLFLSKPIKLSELLADWLAPLGCFVSARTNDAGLFTIAIDRVLPPLESESATSVGASQIHAVDPARWRPGNDRILNAIKFKYRWDVLKEAPADDASVTIADDDSMYEYGERASLEFKVRGWQWDAATAIKEAAGFAGSIFARFGRPYDVLAVTLDRAGWLLKPGDTITLTLAGAPSPDGTRGITSRGAVVVHATHRYWAPGGEPGSTVIVVVEKLIRYSTYSPAARVASAVGGGAPTITLTANLFTTAGSGETDADHFENGDVVLIFDRGDWTTTNQRTLSNRSGNTFDIDLALTVAVGANTRMIPANYSACQATQRRHAYISDNGYPPVLSVATATAFRYV